MDATPNRSLRHLYEACPLCGSKQIRKVREQGCTVHQRYQKELPRTMVWLACGTCGHCFVEGYWTADALRIIFGRTFNVQDPSAFLEKPKTDKVMGEYPIEKQRIFTARIVSRVTTARRRLPTNEAKWIDVGFGNGILLFTAAEWGYFPIGLDLRQKSVDLLKTMGIDARCMSIEDLPMEPDSVAVVSLANVLEHMPFPKTALQRAHSLLTADGVIFISTPNLDTYVWKYLDYIDRNFYWYEIEHYHNFSRQRLYTLLNEIGFQVIDYQINERYRTGMQVIARKRAPRPA